MASINEKFLKEYAAESEFTTEELLETAENLEIAIQNRLNKHFKSSCLRSGSNYWLIEDSSGVWLAFTRFELGEELRRADMEFNEVKLTKVATAYLDQFQRNGVTIEVPGTIARQIEEPVFYPIYVRYPDNWENGQYHSLQQFQELVWRYDMTPAEALDYWVAEYMNRGAADWAAKRDVEPEAVRKNVRQAKEKLTDESLGASHENSNLRTVSIDEIPSGEPYDEENDRYYMPMKDSVEDVE